MKSSTVSLRRRHLMIAGIAGTAAPAVLNAGPVSRAESVTAKGDMGVSGRVLAADGKPLHAALVEIWDARSADSLASTTTDGDGRFFAAVPPAQGSRPRHIHYRVSRHGHIL